MLLLSASTALGQAHQEVFIQQLTARDGLPGTTVADLAVDTDGYLWLATHGGLARYDGLDFRLFRLDSASTPGVFRNFAYRLHVDRAGQIWVGTLNNGVFLFDPLGKRFRASFQQQSDAGDGLCSNWIYDVTEDDQGRIWVSTSEGLSLLQKEGQEWQCTCVADQNPLTGGTFLPTANELWVYNKEVIQPLSLSADSAALLQVRKYPYAEVWQLDAVVAGRDGPYYWLAGRRAWHQDDQGENTIWRWHPHRDSLQPLALHLPNDARISDLSEDPYGRLWIGTWGRGLYRVESPLESPVIEAVRIPGPSENSEANIWNFCPDDFGNLWIGTWRDHLLKVELKPQRPQFIPLVRPDGSKARPGQLTIGEQGRIWISSKEGEIFSWKEEADHWQVYPLPRQRSLQTVDAPPPLLAKTGAIWIGAQNGLFRLHPSTGETDFFALPAPAADTRPDWVKVLQCRGDTLWCGMAHGSVYSFDLSSSTFRAWHEEYTNLGVVNDLLFAQDGAVWVSMSKGIRIIHPDQPEDQQLLDIYQGALELLEAGNGQIWLSSYLGGVHVLNTRGERIRSLSNTPVQDLAWTTSLLEDHQGYLWLAGPDGICRYDTATGGFSSFSELNPFPLPYTANSLGSVVSPDNRLIYALEEGLLVFRPDQMSGEHLPPHPLVRGVSVNDEEVQNTLAIVGPPGTYPNNQLHLSYWQNDITIEYIGLHLGQAAEISYRYQLEGHNNDWIEVRQERIARFPNLPSGSYTFRMQAANSDGVWSTDEAQLRLRIFPPWYARWWAYGLWIGLFLGTVFLVYRFQLHRRLAVAEAARLREMDTLRSALYTNITHEFRTPLTVIRGMSEQAVQYFENQTFAPFGQAMGAIRRNSNLLLNLINQLLDLAKLEAGQLEWNMIQGEVIRFLKYVAESFESWAAAKDLEFQVDTTLTEQLMDFDPPKLQQIISNLLSNAIKFTPAGGGVALRIKKEVLEKGLFLVISVEDSGLGIPAEHLPRIFDRFFQGDGSATRQTEGTGIGLAWTKELVERMDGTIQVESQPEQGSTFIISLPIRQEASLTTALVQPADQLPADPLVSAALESPLDHEELDRILIVEDNTDVRQYLKACLHGHYTVLEAVNGAEGLQLAQKEMPDLIISDVMMPQMDGFELCNRLKNHDLTNHIPIILLTARVDEGSKLKGLARGADAYLPKPFNQGELFIRLRQLIRQRRKLQQRYTQLSYPPQEEETPYSQEDQFIRAVQDLLATHLADEHFGVQALAQELAMSRSQLFRKLKALTGQSIVQYIRHFRLQHARQLLQTTTMTISEVSYAVGFRDPAYFSRVFAKTYGEPPSRWMKPE